MKTSMDDQSMTTLVLNGMRKIEYPKYKISVTAHPFATLVGFVCARLGDNAGTTS